MIALLIGGPFHGTTREVGYQDEVRLAVRKATLSRLPFVGAVIETPAETVRYVRSEIANVYIRDGYEHTPEDEELVREWLNSDTLGA